MDVALWLFAALMCSTVLAEEDPVASTPLGQLRGSRMKTWTGRDFLAFRGVRYAQSPTDNRRFQAPLPMYPWDGISDATGEGPSCVQFFGIGFGDPTEDCLVLNIYTKTLGGKRPVIVFIHPGGFFAQSGKSNFFGPEYLLDQDIVLVTVNFRLGSLGFFSTGDEHAVGNYGLKDQVMALRWVRDNVASFGGDPNSVTIAGDGTGSTSVLLHMLSPMSNGLFKGAIAMSGGVTNMWAVTKNPVTYAHALGRLLNCDTSSSKKLVSCLKALPAQRIQDQLHSLREKYHDPAIVYGAVIEPDLGDGAERFLTDDPVDLIKKKNFAQVPLAIGMTKNEWENRVSIILKNETLREEFNRELETWAPIAFYYERDTPKSKEITHKLMGYYVGGEVKNDSYGLGRLYADAVNIQGIQQSAKLFAEFSSAPVYFYMSSYLGGRTYTYVDKEKTKPLGVVLQDEMLYLFTASKRFPQMIKPTDTDSRAVRLLTSIWSNMAHKRNPTPSELNIEWAPMTKENPQYLDIDRTLSMKPGLPYKERMEFWETIRPTK